ncbi:MAG: ATP-dependent helicase [Parasporobacterium sp.]|nr:ATP-dependent helicase [Parasporobacterium sp.]
MLYTVYRSRIIVLMKLNDSQKAAVFHKDGPALIIAGPGSGKTAVIIRRIQYLIRDCQVPPGQILAVTFSRKAAEEMQERFLSMQADKTVPFFGTCHSIFFMILRKAYGLTSENILTEDDGLPDLPGDSFSGEKDGADLISDLSEGSDPVRISFDEILSLCLELLKKREDIRSFWQRQFRYILVDEFQDLNPVQYEILKILSAPENNLFVVGDDDQSIYSFRGATPQIMKRFLKNYPDSKRFLLNQSFRCPPVILAASQKVIQKNRLRLPKQLESARRDKKGLFQIRKCRTQKDEYLSIAKEIRRLLASGEDAETVAILIRRRQESPLIQTVLNRYQIFPNTSFPSVRLLTMHAAKGLEFKHVFLPDLNEKILPSGKAATRAALEEERRIFYVAMTRASESLRVYFSESIRRRKAVPSRFLDCFLSGHL